MKNLTDKQRMYCLSEAANYPDADAYISDLALSSIWGDAPEDDIPQERIEALRFLWDAANRNVRDIAEAAGLSQRKLAERFSIPYRTVENWCTDQRECSLYIRLMMQEILGLI